MGLKQIHYNLDEIDKKKANFNLIIGEKGNGKSWQVKHKRAILNYLKTGNRFILLRRWREDLSNLWLEQYFADVDVQGLTEGKYNCIIPYRKTLFFGHAEDGKITRGEKIGYAMALSTEQHYSGGSFLDVSDIIFEEFMERGVYLKNEVDKMEYLYSTIDRKRGTTRVWMVGNSVSKINPYIQEWKLDSILRNMKQGEIQIKTIYNENNSFHIAIEYCKSSGGKQMSISNNMIDSGAWIVDRQPTINYNEYRSHARFGFQYKGYKFICEIMTKKEGANDFIFYIKPFVKDFTNKFVVFSDDIKPSIYWQRDIYNSNFPNEKFNNLLKEFKESKIFYCNNQCGTEFKQVIDFTIRK